VPPFEVETLKLGNPLAMVVIAIWHEFGQSPATHVSNARSYFYSTKIQLLATSQLDF
jgi:hypothetical protein